jgi:hypothetical protein
MSTITVSHFPSTLTLWLCATKTASNTLPTEFPITFHDHTGSYAEAYERPIHRNVMSKLWGGEDHDFDFPYHESPKPNRTPNIDLDQTFPRRVDAQMENKTRIALFLGLLEAARRDARPIRNLTGVKFGVLVRKPDSITGNTAFMMPRDPKPIPKERTFFDWDTERHPSLHSGDSEAKWVKLALDNIELHSDMEYDGDYDMDSDMDSDMEEEF